MTSKEFLGEPHELAKCSIKLKPAPPAAFSLSEKCTPSYVLCLNVCETSYFVKPLPTSEPICTAISFRSRAFPRRGHRCPYKVTFLPWFDVTLKSSVKILGKRSFSWLCCKSLCVFFLTILCVRLCFLRKVLRLKDYWHGHAVSQTGRLYFFHEGQFLVCWMQIPLFRQGGVFHPFGCWTSLAKPYFNIFSSLDILDWKPDWNWTWWSLRSTFQICFWKNILGLLIRIIIVIYLPIKKS